MENQNKSKVIRISKVWNPDAELHVPHDSKMIKFASPAFLGNYLNAGKETLSHNLKVPTGGYTASLLHSAYCDSNEPEFQNVKNIIHSDWLWIYNKDGWTDKGVYVIQDLNAEGRTIPLNINELEKMLKDGKEIKGVRFSKDKLVRFAPKETYRLGEHTPDSLSKDGFIIASCDVEGAKKLAEVSSKFRSKPMTYGLEIKDGDNPELRVSAVLEYGGRLHFDGDDWGEGGRGHAFGVLD